MNYKNNGLLIYNPNKQLFAKLKQKSWNLFSKKIERIKTAVQAKKSVR